MPNNSYNNIQNTYKPVSDVVRSKHRLAEISHHFLSDEDERLPAWDKTTVIPVLLGEKNDDYVVYELNRAFNQQNSSSMVLNIENRLTATNNLASLARKQTSDENPDVGSGVDSDVDNEGNGLPDYCLIPASSASTTLALQCNRLIIAVHASLGGVRIAYDQLAFMATLDTDFDVCVIMLGAKNKPEAKRFFGFLCSSAQSLLSVKLECGGYLLQTDEHISSNKTAENEPTEAEIEDVDIATDFHGVAAGLLQKFNPRNRAPTAATRLAAPSRVTALLS